MNAVKEEMESEEKDSKIKIEVKGAEKQPEKKDSNKEEKPLEKLKKSELIQRIEDLREESLKSQDLCLRAQAEMENIKKRAKKDKEDWVKYANETLIKEILPAMDNLEKTISHSHDENALPALREGVELTFKWLKDALAKSGIEEVEALGEMFDPLYHQAVSELEDDNVEPGKVLHELQRGYMLRERLIRPAMVVVSKGKPVDSSDEEKSSELSSE